MLNMTSNIANETTCALCFFVFMLFVTEVGLALTCYFVAFKPRVTCCANIGIAGRSEGEVSCISQHFQASWAVVKMSIARYALRCR